MTKHNVQYSVEEDAARIGFLKRRSGPDFRRISWVIRCSKCPREYTANWDGGMKPEAMAKFMRVRQWDVGHGMRPICPDCVHSKDKGPVAKPEHQNFKPWVPPKTMVFDKLVDAAVKRSHLAVVPKALKELEACEQEIAAIKSEEREVRATLADQAKALAQQARVNRAREARLRRIAEEDAARAAGAKALHIAQLKERASATAPEQAPENHTAPQAQEEPTMKLTVTPSPKISHAVFQCLDGIFDTDKRLYKSGYTDQRVARECGTSEDVVAYLRTETFGALAEDPRISSLRDDLELLSMDAAEKFAALQKAMGELRSRVEQMAHR